jgi:hypothetical protein
MEIMFTNLGIKILGIQFQVQNTAMICLHNNRINETMFQNIFIKQVEYEHCTKYTIAANIVQIIFRGNSRGIYYQDQVHSDQMVLVMVDCDKLDRVSGGQKTRLEFIHVRWFLW